MNTPHRADRARHDAAVGAGGLTATAAGSQPGQPDLDGRRPTTSASPATGSSAARARAARTSPRSARRPAPPSTTPAWPPSTTYSYRVRAVDAAGNLERLLERSPRATTPARRHDAADGADRADGDRGQREPDQPRLDGVDRQRRRHRLPGRALPGRGLHQLRPGRRRPTGTDLQRHRPRRSHQLPLPRAGGRRRRQPERLLRRSPRRPRRRRRHDGADGADRARRRPRSAPTQINLDLDGLDRQRRRHRLPGRALPGRELHQLRPGRDADRPPTFSNTGPAGEHHLPLPRAGGRRRRQPQRLLRHRHRADTARRRHHAADGADGTRPRRRRARRRSTWPGRPRPTTSASPATASSAARARAARTSPRSRTPDGHQPTATPACRRHHLPLPGARGDAAGNLSTYSTIATATTPAAADTTPPTAPAGLTATAVGATPDQPGLDGVDRQRRRHRLPGRALPGRGLHQLRPGRHARRHQPTATPACRRSTTLPLPGAGGRRRRQPERLLERSPTATTPAAPATPRAWSAAWAFDEGPGTTTADASGNGNTGT